MDDETRRPREDAEPPSDAQARDENELPATWEPGATAEPAPAVASLPPDQDPHPVDPIPGWGAPVAWEAPTARSATFDVGSVFGRTLGVLAAHWPVFVALTLPLALIGILVTQIVGDPAQTLSVVVLTLLSVAFSVPVSLATIAAADDANAGRQPKIVGSLVRGTERTLHAIATYIIASIVLAVAVTVATVLSVVSPVVGVVAFLVLLGASVYVLARTALVLPALVLDRLGPVGAIRRSWEVAKGNLWRVVALFILLGLLTTPLSLAFGILSLTGDTIWIVIGGLACVVITPLTSISLGLIYADLTKRQPQPAEPAKGRGRMGLAIAIVGLGVALLVPAIATAGPSFERLMTEGMTASIPDSERGQLVTGLDEGPATTCRPGRLTSTVGRHDEVYLGGYFTRAVQPSEDAVLEVYVDEVLIASNQLVLRMVSVCYFEGPILDLAPARYRFVVRVGSETIAEGFLTVV